MKPTINFIMIRSSNIESVRNFYQSLGLVFIEEQHGNGPIHYANTQDHLVIEIYPGDEGKVPSWKDSGATMFGFYVEDIRKIVDTIDQQNGKIISEPKDSERGLRAVLEDPDGRRVEIIEYKNLWANE